MLIPIFDQMEKSFNAEIIFSAAQDEDLLTTVVDSEEVLHLIVEQLADLSQGGRKISGLVVQAVILFEE